jgi:hypothetical protein
MIFEGVFSPLKAPDRFAELRVDPDLGTICWPNGADIAPEALYDALLRHPPLLRARSGTITLSVTNGRAICRLRIQSKQARIPRACMLLAIPES